MHATFPLLQTTDFPHLRRTQLTTLQVNLGYLCNQTCVHCHVDAGPKRTELMEEESIAHVLAFLRAQPQVHTLDLTGGAPEMNPHFRYLVSQARVLGVQVIDRCNLTILEEPGYEDLAQFLATQQVEVVASLPCYLEDNVNRQRGNGVFKASILALRRLNALGYGRSESGLKLNLVYNPQGPALPPSQQGLEAAYREHLGELDIVFNHLFTITNMPIARYLEWLEHSGNLQGYMDKLVQAFNPATAAGLMCRDTISVGWDGRLFDCDFNQMLDLPVDARGPRTIADLLTTPASLTLPVVTGPHCFGCTAGAGSSCGGATVG
jgi:radical SAM/Cys-rich protein